MPRPSGKKSSQKEMMCAGCQGNISPLLLISCNKPLYLCAPYLHYFHCMQDSGQGGGRVECFSIDFTMAAIWLAATFLKDSFHCPLKFLSHTVFPTATTEFHTPKIKSSLLHLFSDSPFSPSLPSLSSLASYMSFYFIFPPSSIPPSSSSTVSLYSLLPPSFPPPPLPLVAHAVHPLPFPSD